MESVGRMQTRAQWEREFGWREHKFKDRVQFVARILAKVERRLRASNR